MHVQKRIVTILLTFRDMFQVRDPRERRGIAVGIKLPPTPRL
jgi:hypothetical protein